MTEQESIKSNIIKVSTELTYKVRYDNTPANRVRIEDLWELTMALYRELEALKN